MKNYTKITLIAIILLFSIYSLTAQNKEINTNNTKSPKNIILLIGDGMGVSQVYAAYTSLNGNMNITSMPYTGFSLTYSLDKYITDSGAGGSAIATGKKIKNKAISVDSTGKAIKTILEYASEQGLATGLISTSSITHATPASFIAHNLDRNKNEEIAADFMKTNFDVIIGGGSSYFANRDDKRNLLEELKNKNYKIYNNIDEINTQKDSKVVSLIAPRHLPSIIKGRGDMLPKSTEKALQILSKNKKGFFIMIEGSQIDWGGHDNNTDYIVSETIDFDKAVGKALEFAKKNGETLVIVTADHETGGMAIYDGSIKKGEVTGKYTTNDHTGVMVPVFAFGPGAELFTGVQQNTDIFEKCVKLLKLK